jgi:hypothetical protein
VTRSSDEQSRGDALDRPTPLVVEYLDRTHEPHYPRRRHLSQQAIALNFLCLAAVVGLVLLALTRRPSPAPQMVVPILWVGSAWYVFARIMASRSPNVLKAFKLLAALPAALIAPLVLCPLPGDQAVINYFMQYGWHHWPLGDTAFAHFALASFGIFTALFALADVADWIVRWRRWRRTRNLKKPHAG